VIILKAFYTRQQRLEAEDKNPLLSTSMFAIPQLRSGLAVLMSQYMITAAVFFVIPIYLQMTLGYDALQTGIKIFPLSVAVILFSLIGTRLTKTISAKKIVRAGQLMLVVGSVGLLGAISIDLKSTMFAVGMFLLGGGLGLLASQLGNVNMSAVSETKSSEVGGVQGVSQNIGSSLGTALIGSVMVATLTTGFVTNIQTSSLPPEIKSYVQTNSTAGVAIVSANDVSAYAESKGLSAGEVEDVTESYTSAQITALEQSLFVIAALALLTMLFSRNIPDKKPS
jgi:Na+/melibiose symporter-like transporter